MPINPLSPQELLYRKQMQEQRRNQLMEFVGATPDYLKGVAAGVGGMPGDFEGIGRAIVNARMQYGSIPTNTLMPTSEDLGQRMGADTESGGFIAGTIGTPDISDIARLGVLGVGKLKFIKPYLVDDWVAKTGLDVKTLDKFAETGDLQRGRAEIAMTRAQSAYGGGVLSPVIEHVGDLSNRASPRHGFGWGREEALSKAENQLRALKHPYGFEKELNENLISNARMKGKNIDEYKAEVDSALKTYSDEHRKLPVHNEVQRIARDAAVAVGEKRFKDAEELLDKFIYISKDENRYIDFLKTKPRDAKTRYPQALKQMMEEDFQNSLNKVGSHFDK